jgi:hypothetical protein
MRKSLLNGFVYSSAILLLIVQISPIRLGRHVSLKRPRKLAQASPLALPALFR